MSDTQEELANYEEGHTAEKEEVCGGARPVADIALLFNGAGIEGTDEALNIAIF